MCTTVDAYAIHARLVQSTTQHPRISGSLYMPVLTNLITRSVGVIAIALGIIVVMSILQELGLSLPLRGGSPSSFPLKGQAVFAEGTTFNASLVPAADGTYDVGANGAPLRWRDGWFSRNVTVGSQLLLGQAMTAYNVAINSSPQLLSVTQATEDDPTPLERIRYRYAANGNPVYEIKTATGGAWVPIWWLQLTKENSGPATETLHFGRELFYNVPLAGNVAYFNEFRYGGTFDNPETSTVGVGWQGYVRLNRKGAFVDEMVLGAENSHNVAFLTTTKKAFPPYINSAERRLVVGGIEDANKLAPVTFYNSKVNWDSSAFLDGGTIKVMTDTRLTLQASGKGSFELRLGNDSLEGFEYRVGDNSRLTIGTLADATPYLKSRNGTNLILQADGGSLALGADKAVRAVLTASTLDFQQGTTITTPPGQNLKLLPGSNQLVLNVSGDNNTGFVYRVGNNDRLFIGTASGGKSVIGTRNGTSLSLAPAGTLYLDQTTVVNSASDATTHFRVETDSYPNAFHVDPSTNTVFFAKTPTTNTSLGLVTLYGTGALLGVGPSDGSAALVVSLDKAAKEVQFRNYNYYGITLAPSATGRIKLDGNVQMGADARTIADNLAVTPAALTLTPAKSLVTVDCQDANGCAITMSTSGIADDQVVTIVNTSSNTVSFADAPGVSELAGNFSAGRNDSLSLLFVAGRGWVETARSNN
ncbi:MAG: hypothetical protein HY681_11350 [Chloroflexi bacterium]|nr:hypothetical protein [Chloroflexota bacterium]